MRRADSLRRRGPSRTPKKRFLIVCEGEVTEHGYFTYLHRLHRGLVEVEILAGGDPKRLVERAVARKKDADRDAHRMRDQNLRYDQVWCVCDVDEHTRLADAKQQARDNDVQMAISNPSFELWALLHFQDQHAHIERDKVRARCKTFMPEYDKALPCDVLMPLYPEALRRAVGLNESHESRQTAGANPSTGVHLLVEEIRGDSR